MLTTVTKAQLQDPATLAHCRQLLETKQFQDAATLLRDYLQQHPESAEGHTLLGYALYSSLDPSASLAQYTLASQLRQPTAKDLMAVAADYILLKDYSDAEKWLTVVTEWEPANRLAWYYLGRAYYSDAAYPNAMTAFQHLLTLSPRDVSAETNLGLVEEARGDEKRAMSVYALAIEWQEQDHRSDEQPYLRMGMLLAKQGHTDQALQSLLKAEQCGPNNAEVHEQLGRLYETSGRRKEAQQQLERSIRLDSGVASVHYLLGRVYREEGMTSAAQQEFERTSQLMAASLRAQTTSVGAK